MFFLFKTKEPKKKKKSSRIIIKIIPTLVFISLFILIIIGFASKDKLNQYLSQSMIKNADPEVKNNGAAYIDSKYNYTKNKLDYQITFLEFGATGCIACKKWKRRKAKERKRKENANQEEK